MPIKLQIIGELGQSTLLLPELIGQALAANDHVKMCFTLLQEAQSHADHPERIVPPLLTGDPDAERSVRGSCREPDGGLRVPGAERLRALIFDDIAAMIAPLTIAEWPGAKQMVERERSLRTVLPAFDDDRIPAGVVDALTTADRAAGADSLHLLVMDLHKSLNALQGQLATEDIDGARAWRIAEEDRPLVAAFMAGVNQTRALKFDHPGLGTTATRTGDRLIIQNDIGTTDAHVLVLQVDRPKTEGLTATLTYTDVHEARLTFFQSLFKPFGVRWQDTTGRHSAQLTEEANYYLCTGTFDAANRETLGQYLTFLGSRIVFLIDWNRARKCLREFVRREDAAPLLKWAADQNLGHRGLLSLGGEQLLYDAIEFAQQTPLRYGQKLHEAIGPDAAVNWLRFVLRETAEGLLQERSERLIRDEIKAELAGYFHSALENVLAIAAEHAALVFELATAVHDSLTMYMESGSSEHFARAAQRAAKWEQEADALVSRIRGLVQHSHKPEVYLVLLRETDDAADAFEEAAFLMTLLPKLGPAAALLELVRSLAALLVGGAQEAVKLIEAASHVRREGAREDLQDFLEGVDRIVAMEHETDAAERAMRSAFILEAADFRSLQLLLRLAGALEEAADALSRSALILRDHLLNDVVTG